MKRLISVILLSLLCAPAYAQDTQELAMEPEPLDIRTVNDITYVTGGIGSEELEMLKERKAEFNTHALFSAKGGGYVSQVMVRIFNAGGDVVLTEENAGPYLYIELPPGRYGIDASSVEYGAHQGSFTVPASGSVKPVIVFKEQAKMPKEAPSSSN